jgi:hypothetical protein
MLSVRSSVCTKTESVVNAKQLISCTHAAPCNFVKFPSRCDTVRNIVYHFTRIHLAWTTAVLSAIIHAKHRQHTDYGDFKQSQLCITVMVERRQLTCAAATCSSSDCTSGTVDSSL